MEVDVSKRNKRQIVENVRAVVDEFNGRDDIQTKFGEPVLAFLSTTHPLFDTFFARGENDHPKKVYRPGNTLIIHYVPWDRSVAESNEVFGVCKGKGGASSTCSDTGVTLSTCSDTDTPSSPRKACDASSPSEEWIAADRESLWLAMEINKVIKKTLDKVGRIHSNTSTMIDWDREKHRYGWSNKIAAFIGGIGDLGPAGSLHVDGAWGGRAGSISTAALYADEVEADTKTGSGDPDHSGSIDNSGDSLKRREGLEADEGGERTADRLEQIFRRAMQDCRFAGWDGKECSEQMIAACPGRAISPGGIDRQKCQDWCETIDRYTPAPEVCGKCFSFR